ncbi:MAG: hypothetical protein IT537_26905 [Hyphomicrobiales bacterium]|nr:hypothetical protein [Hyphomicrobiales bacterium]
MTYTAAPQFAPGEFRVGSVLSRSWSVLSRNFPMFFLVMAVAYMPAALIARTFADVGEPGSAAIAGGLGGLVMFILSIIAQAVIVYAAFQDMRGRPVRLGESIEVALRRLFPVILLAIVSAILMGLGFMAFIIPGVILFTMWFVSTPVCVVEQLGPMASLGRSSELTKGHRWKVLGLILVMILISITVMILAAVVSALAGSLTNIVVDLAANAIWLAFFEISVVVTYHDLRVAKEGIDIEQITAVFD